MGGDQVVRAVCLSDVRRCDCVANALDFARNTPVVMAHEGNDRSIAGLDVLQLRLLKIRIHSKRGCVDECGKRRSGSHKRAAPQVHVRDIPVAWSVNRCPTQIELGLLELDFGTPDPHIGFSGLTQVGFRLIRAGDRTGHARLRFGQAILCNDQLRLGFFLGGFCLAEGRFGLLEARFGTLQLRLICLDVCRLRFRVFHRAGFAIRESLGTRGFAEPGSRPQKRHGPVRRKTRHALTGTPAVVRACCRLPDEVARDVG